MGIYDVFFMYTVVSTTPRKKLNSNSICLWRKKINYIRNKFNQMTDIV
jgi:hypothetical protein